jgi:hypothetical protein
MRISRTPQDFRPGLPPVASAPIVAAVVPPVSCFDATNHPVENPPMSDALAAELAAIIAAGPDLAAELDRIETETRPQLLAELARIDAATRPQLDASLADAARESDLVLAECDALAAELDPELLAAAAEIDAEWVQVLARLSTG